MIINTGYNQLLLDIMAKRRAITFDDLAKEYQTMIKQHLNEESLSKLEIDLKVLEEEQFIRICNENIIYIGS
jgi:hypothetical protein